MLTRRSFIKRLLGTVAALPLVKKQLEETIERAPGHGSVENQGKREAMARRWVSQDRPILFEGPPYDACATTAPFLPLGESVAPTIQMLTQGPNYVRETLPFPTED